MARSPACLSTQAGRGQAQNPIKRMTRDWIPFDAPRHPSPAGAVPRLQSSPCLRVRHCRATLFVISAFACLQQAGRNDAACWVLPFSGHSRVAGMNYVNHWIPAFAGMTEGAAVRHLSGMAKGLSGWQPVYSLLVVIPAQAGIQETGGAVVNG